MRGNKWWAVLSAGALSVACGGTASNDADNGNGNGAVTRELRATGLPLGSALRDLDAASQATVCKALGDFSFRLKAPICDAFVESGIILNPSTLDQDRRVCAESLDVCHMPSEPVPACAAFPDSCAVTLAELDQCYSDIEGWLGNVPTCENMTYETAPHSVGPGPSSCLRYNAACRQGLE